MSTRSRRRTVGGRGRRRGVGGPSAGGRRSETLPAIRSAGGGRSPSGPAARCGRGQSWSGPGVDEVLGQTFQGSRRRRPGRRVPCRGRRLVAAMTGSVRQGRGFSRRWPGGRGRRRPCRCRGRAGPRPTRRRGGGLSEWVSWSTAKPSTNSASARSCIDRAWVAIRLRWSSVSPTITCHCSAVDGPSGHRDILEPGSRALRAEMAQGSWPARRGWATRPGWWPAPGAAEAGEVLVLDGHRGLGHPRGARSLRPPAAGAPAVTTTWPTGRRQLVGPVDPHHPPHPRPGQLARRPCSRSWRSRSRRRRGGPARP